MSAFMEENESFSRIRKTHLALKQENKYSDNIKGEFLILFFFFEKSGIILRKKTQFSLYYQTCYELNRIRKHFLLFV